MVKSYSKGEAPELSQSVSKQIRLMTHSTKSQRPSTYFVTLYMPAILHNQSLAENSDSPLPPCRAITTEVPKATGELYEASIMATDG